MLALPATNTSAQDVEPWIIVVDDTSDEEDFVNNSVCSAGEPQYGPCTLRAAIDEANKCPADAGACEGGVIIQVPPGNYTLTISPDSINDNDTGDLDISPINRGALFLIEGTDATNPPIIDANGLDRVFRIDNSDNMVTLRNLIIRGGKLTMTDTDTALKIGAGISNQGVLSLENVVIEDNQIICALTNTGGCYQGEGGGIFSGNQLTINTTTIRNNTAIRGGGIFYNGSAKLKILSSTISGNEAVQTGGGIENYGSILIQNSTISDNRGGGTGGITNSEMIDLFNVTIAGNVSYSGAAANVGNSGQFTIRSSIIAYPISPYITSNCSNSGTWITFGMIIYSDSSCGTGPNILSNTDPKLTPLAWLGGPTMTRGLLKGSPAHDAVAGFCIDHNGYTLTIDQRGVNRDNHCDLGAFEGEAHGIFLPMVRR